MELFQKYLLWKTRKGLFERYFSKYCQEDSSSGSNIQHKKSTPGVVKAASVQTRIKLFKDPLDYTRQIHGFVHGAWEKGAELIVFPENNNLQLLGMLPGAERVNAVSSSSFRANSNRENEYSVAGLIGFMTPVVQRVINSTFPVLARLYGVYIMAGSFLLFQEGRLVNRAFLFSPHGTMVGYQDKAHLMPMEVEWGISPSHQLKVFETSLGKVAMPVCMDATYFETFRILELQGARIITLPIANPEDYNYWLAMRGIWPRVQESLVYGIKSALVGEALGFTFTGKAGIYAPLELTPQRNGILAEANSPYQESLITAEIDLSSLERLRKEHPRRDFNLSLYDSYFPSIYFTSYFTSVPRKIQYD